MSFVAETPSSAGLLVRFRGLESSPELNGEVGTVVACEDRRLVVEMPGGRKVMVRGRKLEAVAREPKPLDVLALPEFEGTGADVVEWFRSAMPMSSSCLLNMYTLNVPGKSPAQLDAPQQWLYSICRVVVDVAEQLVDGSPPRAFAVSRGDKVIPLQFEPMTPRRAPDGLEGIAPGAPILPIVFKLGWTALQNCVVIKAASDAEVAYGLRELSQRVRGEVSFLAPPILRDRRVSRAPEICVACDKVRAKGESFKHCSGCGAIYCSKDCQVAHWKQHKPSCAGRDVDTSGRPSVVVDVNPRELGSELPKNVHGNKLFIVKVEKSLDPRYTCRIYDRTSSFQTQANPAEALLDFVRQEPNFGGLKAYLHAKREGPNLRLFIDDYAPPQSW